MTSPNHHHKLPPAARFLAALGAPVISLLNYIGALAWLFWDSVIWVLRAMFLQRVRFGKRAFDNQLIRLGIRAIAIIMLVSGCIGLILGLQMAPPLADFGQTEKVANIIGVAVLRELGPLISAIVLTGFAGASIAAEIGTMVVGEEIEAMHSMALNPVRFLVVPRVLATIIALVILAVIGDVVAIAAGFFMGVMVLDIEPFVYISNTFEQIKLSDFLTGCVKAAIFGMLIALIACHNGLRVHGGAAGVGRATTDTVVHSIVSIIFADFLFTALFYLLNWT